MRIQYDATLDEVVDANLRHLDHFKVARRWQWQGAVATALLTGFLIFVILPWLPGSPPSLTTRGVWAGVGVVAALVGFPTFHRRSLKGRLRKLVREQLGTDGPFHFEVELTEAGIWTKQSGAQISFDWANVKQIEHTPDSLDFVMKDGGFVVVRKRGFDSNGAFRQFAELAEQHLARARAAQDAGPNG